MTAKISNHYISMPFILHVLYLITLLSCIRIPLGTSCRNIFLSRHIIPTELCHSFDYATRTNIHVAAHNRYLQQIMFNTRRQSGNKSYYLQHISVQKNRWEIRRSTHCHNTHCVYSLNYIVQGYTIG